MELARIAIVVQWVLAGWMALILAVILVRMLSGRIILSGLLRTEKNWPFGMDRLQLVFVTLLFAGGYALFALDIDQLKTMPDVPTPLLLILIGSNGTYLAVKYYALLGGGGRGR